VTRMQPLTDHDPMTASLRIRDLVFSYGARRVFDGFSADADPGITWIQGPNGCGKSTLLRLLAGALAPLHGSFALADARVAASPGWRAHVAEAPLAWRRQTFWCQSDPPPTPWLTIAECLGFVSGLYAGDHDAALRREVEAFGLANALDTPLRDASLGQQRKTLLALALALPVSLLLLDEPLNALDAASTRHLADTLAARAAEGRQVILLTSHVAPHVPVRGTWALGETPAP